MHSDNYILFLASIVCLLAIWLVFRLNKNVGVLNLILFSVYSAYGYYYLLFVNTQGAALAYWFYLMMLTILHTVSLLLYWFFAIRNSR